MADAGRPFNSKSRFSPGVGHTMDTTWYRLDIYSNDPQAAERESAAFVDFLRRAVVSHGPTAHLAVYHRTLSTTEQTYILRPAAADLVLKSEDLAAFRSKLTKLDAAPDLERHTMISLGGRAGDSSFSRLADEACRALRVSGRHCSEAIPNTMPVHTLTFRSTVSRTAI
jgi:hypothetical protein